MTKLVVHKINEIRFYLHSVNKKSEQDSGAMPEKLYFWL